MKRAWRTFVDSGAAFLIASMLSIAAGLERESGAWISFTLATVWAVLGVSNLVRYRRKQKRGHESAE